MKRLIAFLTGIFLIVQLNGQGAKYIIQNYDLMNEISLNGSVWCMVQDTTGLLYFGADYGIVTYDGTSWKLSSKDQSMVRSLMTDSGHRIFYGGFDDFGILEPNPATGLNFRSLVGDLPDSLRVFGDIWSINECDGRIFFQSRNRIFILGQGGVISAAVNDTYHRGFVMNGKYTVNQKGIGLTFFDGTGFKLLAGGEYFEKMVISSMISLSDNLLLIGTRNNGAFRYNTVKGTISQPFPGFPETNSLLIRNNIYHGILLPDGTLAVGTLYGGTLIMSTDGKILKVLNSQHGLRDNANYHLSVTSDYNLWICTSNGISAYNINSPFILWDYTTGIDGVILDIEDFENSIFIGSLIGLYEIQTDKFSPDPIRTNARCLLNMEVWDIRQIRHSGRDYLFLGTGKGLFRLDGHVPVRVRESGTVLKVLQSRSDPDLILAMRSDELDIYRWKGVGLVYQGTLINLYNGLRTAVEDGKGFLWIGTRKSGVVRIAVSDLERAMNGAPRVVDFNALNLSRRNFTFNSILTDALEFQGQCLFSNSTGLYQFDYSRQDFEKCNLFGPEIMEYGKMISTLNKDSHGNIWVGGEDIFVRRPDGNYTLDKLNFKQLRDIFSAFVFLHNPDQKTWIGGNSGLYLYDNSIRMKPPATLQTLITKIVINSDSTLYINAPNLDWLKPQKYASGKNNPLKIDLDKSNSKVTFCYSLPFFDSEKRTVYSYLLDGYSDKWSEWSGETSLTFSNLKPRTYCFRVRSRTIYNQVGKTAEVYFTVPRRWYYSEYAIAGYLVIFVLMVYRIAGYLSKNKIKKHLRIEDVIQKRIQESKRSQILSLIKTQMAADDQAGGQPADGFQTVPEGHQFLTKALKTLELHMSDHQFTAGMFCREMGMSQARVYRKLISLTGMSINEFIRNIRLKKAAQLLVESDHSISEIAYMTGFGSPGYFSKCFKAEFGMNPRDFAPNRKKE